NLHGAIFVKLETFALTAVAVGALLGCGGGKDQGTSAAAATRGATAGVDLTGAGATFPYPIYSKWFSDYAQQKGVKINYQSIGSGGGIRQLSEGTVDFGASDAPMSDAEMARTKGPVMHFPTVIGAVAVTYNLPGLSKPLQLDGATLAALFDGKISKWNDPRLATLNPGVKLPATDVLVVHRSDGSGTTYIFSDYLSAVDAGWAKAPGKGKELSWPVGLGAKGNEGVAGQVKQTPGAVGYVELAYAKQNNLPVAALRNAAGAMVLPSIASATAAAAGKAASLPANTDYRISIVNAPGQDAYPIASFTWLLVYRTQADATKGRKLRDFLHWYLQQGEHSAASLEYAPLPQNMITRLDARVDSIQVGQGA
ncbi:MAG TPA: phosphate ABC transporter substrate-binding protein PstS, partial [Gemmatimonadaceae bacterium]|nr:phosphate ABC transporter substrate-binding protein PstS [Gemmatimonadaceae bacterium]